MFLSMNRPFSLFDPEMNLSLLQNLMFWFFGLTVCPAHKFAFSKIATDVQYLLPFHHVPGSVLNIRPVISVATVDDIEIIIMLGLQKIKQVLRRLRSHCCK